MENNNNEEIVEEFVKRIEDSFKKDDKTINKLEMSANKYNKYIELAKEILEKVLNENPNIDREEAIKEASKRMDEKFIEKEIEE